MYVVKRIKLPQLVGVIVLCHISLLRPVVSFCQAADTEPPIITSLDPVHEAIDVDINSSDFFIQFNEFVELGTGYISLRRSSDNSLIKSLSVFDGRGPVSVSGGLLEISFPAPLPDDTEMYIEVCATCIMDDSGNVFPGIAAGAWSFTTENTPPDVSSLAPANGAEDVALNATLIIEFDPGTILEAGPGILAIKRMDDDSYVFAEPIINLSITDNVISYVPPRELPENTELYVVLEGGDPFNGTTITDFLGNGFSGLRSKTEWSFTTVDNTPPNITSFFPENNSSSVAVNTSPLFLGFDEDIQLGSGTINLRNIVDDSLIESFPTDDPKAFALANFLQLTLDSELPENTQVYIEVCAACIEDHSGNVFPGLEQDEWSFTTEDLSPPLVVSLSPENGTQHISVNESLTITFSETIVAGSGSMVIRKSDDDSDVLSVDIGNVDITENVLSFIAEGLNNEISYYVVVEPGAIQDESGNNFNGLSSTTDWVFTTADVTAPNIQLTAPANGEKDVSLDADFVLTYDQHLVRGSGVIQLLDATTSTIIESFSDGSRISILDNVITIDPTEPLDPGSHYRLLVDDGAILDNSANATPYHEITFSTSKLNQSIEFERIPNLVFGGVSYQLSATASSGLPVDYQIISGPAALNGNHLNILGAGEITISVTQKGNDVYESAMEILQTVVVAKASVEITLDNLTQEADGTPRKPEITFAPLRDFQYVLTFDGSTNLPTEAGSYEIVLTIVDDNYQGSVTASFNLITILGLSTRPSSVVLFPNPASDQINFHMDIESNIRILSLKGEVMMEQMVRPTEALMVNFLESGVYLIHIQDEAGAWRYVNRFIKK